MASFGPIAPYYDKLMRRVPYRMWTSYYQLLLAHMGSHPKRLLDVCCGTGTTAEVLTREGYQVEGFDKSAPMIEVARKKALENGLDIAYHVSDAAELDLGKTYEGAYSFFDSLNYISDPAALRATFQRVAAHLEPGGSFVFDLNTAYAFETRMFDQQDLRPASELRYKWRGEFDAATRLITVRMRFWHLGEEFEETHVQRAYDEREIRAMLAAAGFGSIKCFHSYTLDPPRAASDRLHYCCALQ